MLNREKYAEEIIEIACNGKPCCKDTWDVYSMQGSQVVLHSL
jgi:hypothetical protein|nr:MAG TPA: protein of unknown function (DUF3337) [Caudoviricetes sp.]